MSGFKMLTDSRNIMLLTLSAVSAEWKPLAFRAAVRASKKIGSKSCGRKRAIRCCCRFTNISAIRSSHYPAGRFVSLAKSQVGNRLTHSAVNEIHECYGGDETLGIIDDSDEIFRAIQGLISKVN
jgi:hypothetical protein